MNALSRREEENLLKITKERALKECHEVVKGAGVVLAVFIPDAQQASPTALLDERYLLPGRAGVSFTRWRSVFFYSAYPWLNEPSPTDGAFSTGPEPYERVRTEYLRLRGEQRAAKLRDHESAPPS